MSGAKNCPETPRQKMIGMMYLVLTAMLALNVSSEILNGFTMVDNSLHKTIESAELRNLSLYADFQSLNDKNPLKVKAWLRKNRMGFTILFKTLKFRLCDWQIIKKLMIVLT